MSFARQAVTMRRGPSFACWCSLAFSMVLSFASHNLMAFQGQPMSQPTNEEEPVGFFNLPMPTAGGQQFWTDFVHRGGWRIQQNSETGHFRLLDGSNIRHAWGNLAHCKQVLRQLETAGKVVPEKGRVVILLHGLIRTSNSMQPMAKFLQQHEFATINLQYASSRKQVEDHAAALHSVIEHLDPQVTDIYFVAHSLGNIVTRRYLGDHHDAQTGRQGDPRIRRMVMLGPPNQGSRVARLLNNSVLFHTIAGKSGAQLSHSWEKLESTLATPSFEFGIIAGGQATDQEWSNFVLKGKDDYTVSVEETKLAGAADFLVRPLWHSNMMKQQSVFDATLNFFDEGYFVSESEKQPLNAESNSGR
ncbi:MAG: lipase [Planctomycetota bacterium]